MFALKLPDGRLVIPVRAESEDGVVGDGEKVVAADSPEAKKWGEMWTRPAPPSVIARYPTPGK